MLENYPFGCSFKTFLLEFCLYSSGKPISNKIPAHFDKNSKESIDIPFDIKYSDIPLDTIVKKINSQPQIYISIFDCFSHDKLVLIGGSSISLFNENKMVRTGKYKIKIWSGKEPHLIDTPGELPEDDLYSNIEKIQINKKEQNWLDNLTDSKITNLDNVRTREINSYL
jgi:hypothetical protein